MLKKSEDTHLAAYNAGLKGTESSLKKFKGKPLSAEDMSKIIGISSRIYKN